MASPCDPLSRRNMEVEADAGVEEMVSLIEDYQDGDLKKGELYCKLGDMNQGKLAKDILILCDSLNDCECDCGDLCHKLGLAGPTTSSLRAEKWA
jgi:hypothetical protein